MMRWEFYRAGWRPAAGWVAVCGLVELMLVYPTAVIVFAWVGKPLPGLDMTNVIAVLGAAGGLAALRTVERVSGNSADNPGRR